MKNIVLTGFMGTGKTTVGKLLAKTLNRHFFDTDEMIEQQMKYKFPKY
jgi:shikimate kinase